jgi:hypothetical protein
MRSSPMYPRGTYGNSYRVERVEGDMSVPSVDLVRRPSLGPYPS